MPFVLGFGLVFDCLWQAIWLGTVRPPGPTSAFSRSRRSAMLAPPGVLVVTAFVSELGDIDRFNLSYIRVILPASDCV